MKLIIDIPESLKNIIDIPDRRLDAEDLVMMADSIQNGKYISEETYNDFMDWMRKNFCCGKGEEE